MHAASTTDSSRLKFRHRMPEFRTSTLSNTREVKVAQLGAGSALVRHTPTPQRGLAASMQLLLAAAVCAELFVTLCVLPDVAFAAGQDLTMRPLIIAHR